MNFKPDICIITALKNKEKYIELCKKETTIPVFQMPWWLDATVDHDNWDVVLTFHEGEITGAMPFFINCKMGLRIITMPRFISMMGIWIKPIIQKEIDRLHHEQKISSQLIESLPSFDYFNQSFYYTYTNWLPFYWKGFKQTTRYTYVLENIENPELIFKQFAHSKRKNILRSEKLLTIKQDLSVDEFYNFHKICLEKEGKKIDYSLSLLTNLIEAAYIHKSGKIIYATDNEGRIHSALFTIWNRVSSFNLINPIDPEQRNSGSSSLLIKEMINYVKDKTNRFDFEGSMDPYISESFRRFGATQKPYFVIHKTNSWLYKIYAALKQR